MNSINPLITLSETNAVLIFDGECLLCNAVVKFVFNADKKRVFRFCTLAYVNQQNIELISFELPDSVIVMYKNKFYLYSDAVIVLLSKLGGIYRVLAFLLKIIPLPFRNFLYKYIAANRYRWFGKSTSCMIPDREWNKVFLH